MINSIKGWDFSRAEIDFALKNKILLNPSIDLTNACNLNCPYCYIEEKNSIRKKKRPNELSFEETLKVIDEFEGLGARTINIVGAGEPTVDFYFKEIIDYIFDKGITTVLFTNGIKLANNQELINFLHKRNVSIVLKLNSFDADIQDLVAGKIGYSKEKDKALKLLIEQGFNRGEVTRLGVDTIVFKGNLLEIPLIHKWCRENNIFPITADYIPTGRTQDGEFSSDQFKSQKFLALVLEKIAISEGRELLKKIEEIDKEYGVRKIGKMAYYGGGGCTQIIGVYIDIEGNIYPCVAKSRIIKGKLVEGCLGNIRDGVSVSKLWLNYHYFNDIRKSYTGNCPYKITFLNLMS